MDGAENTVEASDVYKVEYNTLAHKEGDHVLIHERDHVYVCDAVDSYGKHLECFLDTRVLGTKKRDNMSLVVSTLTSLIE